MSQNQKEVLEAEVLRLKNEVEAYKQAGQETYNDLIQTGAILFKLMEVVGIDEFMDLPPENRKTKLIQIIMKKVSALVFSKDSSEKFNFLSDILPLHEKYKEAIEAYLSQSQPKEIIE